MWIELHDSAADHGKIRRVAQDLGVRYETAFGLIALVWLYVLKNSADGILESDSPDELIEDLEHAAKWTDPPLVDREPGALFKSMVKRRLIDVHEEHWAIHDWDEYSGSLKAADRKRAQRLRKRKSRATKKAVTEGVAVTDGHSDVTDGHSDVTHLVPPVTQNERTNDQNDQNERTTAASKAHAATAAIAAVLQECYPRLLVGERAKPISHSDLAKEFVQNYPELNIAREVRRSRTWIDDNPTKRKKKDEVKYVRNWLQRETKRTGDAGGKFAPSEDEGRSDSAMSDGDLERVSREMKQREREAQRREGRGA